MNRIETLLEYYREDPDDAFTVFALASEYNKAGDVANAKEHFEMLVLSHPNYVGTYYHLGKLYEKLNLRERALQIYEAGIDVATQIRDQHSRSELQAAKLNLELEENE